MNKIIKPLRSGQITIPAGFREKQGKVFLSKTLNSDEEASISLAKE